MHFYTRESEMRGLKIEMTFRKKMNFSTCIIYGIFFHTSHWNKLGVRVGQKEEHLNIFWTLVVLNENI